MGNPVAPTVHSKVPNVEVNKSDGSTVLTVQVVGFAEGKSVDVYGYVTQPTGAYASFRETQDIPKADPVTGAAELTVTVPADQLTLDAEQPVTVLTWVSEFWPSMLTAAAATSETGETKAEWAIDEAASDRWRSQPSAPGWVPSA
jgi:hypothetical protein